MQGPRISWGQKHNKYNGRKQLKTEVGAAIKKEAAIKKLIV